MENLNSREYLDKCKAVVLENLRYVEAAPGTQLQHVPPDWVLRETDEEVSGVWVGEGGPPYCGFARLHIHLLPPPLPQVRAAAAASAAARAGAGGGGSSLIDTAVSRLHVRGEDVRLVGSLLQGRREADGELYEGERDVDAVEEGTDLPAGAVKALAEGDVPDPPVPSGGAGDDAMAGPHADDADL